MAGSWIKHLLTYKIVDQTPIPCVPVTASPGLKPKGGGGREERMIRRSQTGQAWLELQSQLMQQRRDWGPRCAKYPRKHHHVPPLVILAQPVPVECRLKYK